MGGHRLLVLVAVAGCFSKPEPPTSTEDASVQGDASVDADPCVAWGPWGAPKELAGVNDDAESDFAPALTRDELHLVWERGGTLMEAERTSVTDGWTNVRAVPLADFGGGPRLSDDGLQIWFHAYGPNADILTATRAAIGAPWGAGTPVAPFATGEYERDLEISWNGLDAVLYVGEDSVGTQEDIAFTSRATPSEPFASWQRIPTASRLDSYDCCPGISPDGLEVLWETDALWMVTRSSRGEAFGTPQMVPGLSAAGSNYGDPHFNAQGNRLYFASQPSGTNPQNYNLHVVERSCVP